MHTIPLLGSIYITQKIYRLISIFTRYHTQLHPDFPHMKTYGLFQHIYDYIPLLETNSGNNLQRRVTTKGQNGLQKMEVYAKGSFQHTFPN